jgi:hypothetical protein
MVFRTDCERKREEKHRKRSMRLCLEDGTSTKNGNDDDHGRDENHRHRCP